MLSRLGGGGMRMSWKCHSVTRKLQPNSINYALPSRSCLLLIPFSLPALFLLSCRCTWTLVDDQSTRRSCTIVLLGLTSFSRNILHSRATSRQNHGRNPRAGRSHQGGNSKASRLHGRPRKTKHSSQTTVERSNPLQATSRRAHHLYLPPRL